MFDIPELDDIVCLQLRRNDLSQCARVNKKWHDVVTPYLWRDISHIPFVSQQKAFRRVVLDDYLDDQEHQQSQEEDHSLKQHIQKRSSPSLSPLAKYGPCIRTIPEPARLLEYLRSTGQAEEPATHDLLCHLLKHCSAIEVQHLRLYGDVLQSNHLMRTVADFILPHARSVLIRTAYGAPVQSWRLKYLLARCSSKLEELTLDLVVSDTEDGRDGEEEHEEEEVSNAGAQPKYLRLLRCGDKSDSKAFWSSLWRRCVYVERLEVCDIADIVQSLAEGMLSHMPNLSRIDLGSETFCYKDDDGYDVYYMELMDEHVATLLSSSRRGWKAVQMRSSASFGEASTAALANHFPTLEELVVLGGLSFVGNDLVRVLSSCPNIHTLVTIDDGIYYNSDNMSVELEANTFIDLDPGTGALNTWACETSLKVLKVIITYVDNTTCLSHGGTIQSQVYERLARLVNLKTLWLGHDARVQRERLPDESMVLQEDCLRMSLESGLGKLEGLVALRELNVSNMETRIGWRELQWMTEHWPRLRIIIGLDGEDDDKEAVQWLREHCPDIKVLVERWRHDD
ncbi:hypothetical protein BGX26_008463 [Mortierella sp. AD094]|nr:hypothetical protein BGX26_008463 [Mortierella sp. AD094]